MRQLHQVSSNDPSAASLGDLLGDAAVWALGRASNTAKMVIVDSLIIVGEGQNHQLAKLDGFMDNLICPILRNTNIVWPVCISLVWPIPVQS